MKGSIRIEEAISGALTTQLNTTGEVSKTQSLKGNLTAPVAKVIDGDYEKLSNKPSIEGVTLEKNKTFKQLGLDTLSVQEIEKILYLD